MVEEGSAAVLLVLSVFLVFDDCFSILLYYSTGRGVAVWTKVAICSIIYGFKM